MDNSLWDDLEDMSCPLNRLRTFVNWPHAFPTPAMLADAGFYFASGPDTTKCFCCKGEIGHWTPQMFPGEIHMERFNTCPFIARENARSPMNNLPPPSTQMQVACNGVGQANRPAVHKYPEYRNMNDRMLSFLPWDSSHHRPVRLAAAGFIYEGRDDRVKCFSCGIRLHEWEPDEDPWVKHARYSPTCEHVLSFRRREFHGAQAGIPAYLRDVTVEDQCLVCEDDVVSIEFLPCGHRCTCKLCAMGVLACPSCRMDIDSSLDFTRRSG